MSNRFDLEQQIMDCWHVTDDLECVFEHLMETNSIDRDAIANIILGMQGLYQLKFEKLFNTFEQLINDRKVI